MGKRMVRSRLASLARRGGYFWWKRTMQPLNGQKTITEYSATNNTLSLSLVPVNKRVVHRIVVRFAHNWQGKSKSKKKKGRLWLRFWDKTKTSGEKASRKHVYFFFTNIQTIGLPASIPIDPSSLFLSLLLVYKVRVCVCVLWFFFFFSDFTLELCFRVGGHCASGLIGHNEAIPKAFCSQSVIGRIYVFFCFYSIFFLNIFSSREVDHCSHFPFYVDKEISFVLSY